MDCKTLVEIFAGERSEDLSETESAAFDEHLNGCAECLQALATAEEGVAPLTDWSAPEPSPAEWERVAEHIQLELKQPNGRVVAPRTKSPLYFAFAAAALFLIGTTLLFVNRSGLNRGQSGSTAFINGEDPKPAANPKDGTNSDGDTNTDGDTGTDAVTEVVDRPESEILEHAGDNGYKTEAVNYDGLACLVIREQA
jgi:hypothetical protein